MGSSYGHFSVGRKTSETTVFRDKVSARAGPETPRASRPRVAPLGTGLVPPGSPLAIRSRSFLRTHRDHLRPLALGAFRRHPVDIAPCLRAPRRHSVGGVRRSSCRWEPVALRGRGGRTRAWTGQDPRGVPFRCKRSRLRGCCAEPRRSRASRAGASGRGRTSSWQTRRAAGGGRPLLGRSERGSGG